MSGLKINFKGLFVWKKLFSYNIGLNLAEYGLALSHFHPGISLRFLKSGKREPVGPLCIVIDMLA